MYVSLRGSGSEYPWKHQLGDTGPSSFNHHTAVTLIDYIIQSLRLQYFRSKYFSLVFFLFNFECNINSTMERINQKNTSTLVC